MMVRVFNYNTHEKVAAFEAHADYIRSIAVHPTQPFVLTSSDDMVIKLWDWERGWKNVQVWDAPAPCWIAVPTLTFAAPRNRCPCSPEGL